MKHVSILAVLFGGTLSSAAQTINLTGENNHSTVGFVVPISGGLTRITGKFTDFDIRFTYVDSSILKSVVKATIKVGSIQTGIAARDEDLKTGDFFDSEKFPEIVFESRKIIQAPKGFVAQGKLTLHGVTREVDLPFLITGKSGPYTMGFTSRLSIKRSDFGVGTTWKHTSDDNFIADEILVEIDFWTKKVKEPGK